MSYQERDLSTDQHRGWNSHSLLCATSIRLCWLEGERFSMYTEFLFWFFMILTYGAFHGPFHIAQLYWLPIFNIGIYITLSRARKLPLNTVNSQVVFDLVESLSLGKYIEQTFSKNECRVLSSRRPLPLLNKPTGSCWDSGNSFLGGKKPVDFSSAPLWLLQYDWSSLLIFPWLAGVALHTEQKPRWKLRYNLLV